VLSFLGSKLTAGENGSEQSSQVQNGDRCHGFLPLLVILWTFAPFLKSTIERVSVNSRTCPSLQKEISKPVWWLTPVILAIQVVELGRIDVGDQPGQKVLKTLIKTNAWAQWSTYHSQLCRATQTEGSQCRPAWAYSESLSQK
jgi:hypothetical protein